MNAMRSVMLFFGSFNPIHKGHIAVAEMAVARGLCDELWFVVSPHNPLKETAGLIDENDRLRMVEAAIAESPAAARMRACDVEFSMPRPSYTVDTLDELERRWPGARFSILAGSDVAEQIERWKEWRRLTETHTFYIYPRLGYDPSAAERHGFVPLGDVPLEDYSSTRVREALSEEGGAGGMLPAAVEKYIKEKGIWNTRKK